MGRYPGAPESDASGSSVVGRGLSIIGRHVYAYSGELTIANSFTTVLEFTTGAGYIVALWQPVYMEDEPAGDDYCWRIFLNGAVIYQTLMYSNAGNAGQAFAGHLQIVIPPFTNVMVDAKNVSDSSTNNVGAMISGRLYATGNE